MKARTETGEDGNGPRELAELALTRRREAVAAGALAGNISEQGLAELVAIAYSASLMREEAEFVQCQLYVPADENAVGFGTVTTRFPDDIEIVSAQVVRKMAAAAPLPGRALLLAERDGKLVARGIIELRFDHEILPVGAESLSSQPGLKGAMVSVLGPGRISVSDCFPQLQLAAGRITSPIPRVIEYPFLLSAFEPIIQTIFAGRAKFTYQLPDRGDPPTVIPYMVADSWQRVLSRTVAAEHGGAFAIVDFEAINLSTQVEVKYPLEPLQFGRRLVDLWEASFRCAEDERVQLQRFYRWRDAWVALDEATKSIAAFSEVDGCVLLDRKLSVRGFGAKLAAKAEEGAQQIRFVDAFTRLDDPGLPERVAKLGTRHGSAFRFCRANPGAIVFVVSQDGDIRVFVRNGLEVAMVEASSFGPEMWPLLRLRFSK